MAAGHVRVAALPSAGAVPPPRVPADAHADVPLPARPSAPWRQSASRRIDATSGVLVVPPRTDSTDVTDAAVEARQSMPSRPVSTEKRAAPSRGTHKTAKRVRAMFIGAFALLAALHVAGLISADDSQLPLRREPRPAARPLPPPPMETCPTDSDVFISLSPEAPRTGETLRVLAASYRSLAGARLQAVVENGTSWVADSTVLGGPTWAVVGNVPFLRPGTIAIRVRDANRRLVACAEVEVTSRREAPRAQPFGAFRGAWPVTAEWDQRHETLFSAWITKLFDVEPGARAGWAPLHQVLKDPSRNMLHDSLGLGEDDYNVSTHDTVEIRADCADTLYALRAYFAWKMGLPFLFHHCLRGDAREGPRCIDTITNLDPHFGDEPNPVRRFNAFMGQRIASLVHSGTTRTLPEVQTSDFYPIELSREALRPGTVFINPYGHVLINTQWAEQQPGRPGALFAIDGHPGASVTHKAFARVWFPYMGWLRTGGFKAFRPAAYEDGAIRPLTDDEIRARPWLPPPSESQHQLSTEQWYERMAEIQNPQRVDPVEEARATVRYLHELLTERVRIVDGAPTEPVPMPQRPFSGFGAPAAWRQHATPQLDLRILVTLERLDELPELAERGRHPFTRAVSDNELRTIIHAEMARLSIRYRASDGRQRRVTLAQVADRRDRFAVGYDPNDCPEYRWGESTEGDAFRTCSRRAPRNEWLRMLRLSSRLEIRWVPNHQ